MIYKGFRIKKSIVSKEYFAFNSRQQYLLNYNIIVDNIKAYSNITKLCYFTSEQDIINSLDYIYKYNPEELL